MKSVILILILLISSVLPAFGQHSMNADLDYVTRYMWRGFDVLDDRTAIQPSITYSHDGGFSVNVWTSFGLCDRNEVNDLDEVDVTFSYSKPINDIFSVEAGLVNYLYPVMDDFPDDNSMSQEIFFTVSAAYSIGSPYLSVYYDFNLGDGLFIQAGYSREFELNEDLKPVFSVDLGYNNGSWGVQDMGLSNLDAGLTLPVNFDKFSLGFGLYSVFILNDELRDMNRGESTELWGKISLSYSFN